MAGLEIAAYSAGLKFGVLGGIGASAEVAAQSFAREGATILSTPAKTFGSYFGLQARAVAAESAFNLAQRLGAASNLAFKAAHGLGVVGGVVTAGSTAFYATARAYCAFECRGQ